MILEFVNMMAEAYYSGEEGENNAFIDINRDIQHLLLLNTWIRVTTTAYHYRDRYYRL